MIGKGIWSFILGLLFLYLQILVMPALAIWSVIPNILIPWLIYIVWTRPRDLALVLVCVCIYYIQISNYFIMQHIPDM